MSRGGKRVGAGRKRGSEPTVTIRVPLSQKEKIKQGLKPDSQTEKNRIVSNHLTLSKEILSDALNLKANAGGKIKQEIRKALVLLNESAG